MQNMFGSCTKLTSLNISTFDTNKVTNFTNMFENDNGLNLYLDSKICSNLKQQLPNFINVHDISEN